MTLPGQRRGNRRARCFIKQFLWTRSSWRCREQLRENKHPTSNLHQPRRDGQFLPYIRFCICCTGKNITPFLFALPCLVLETQDIHSCCTLNALHCDMLPSTILLQNWFCLICTFFMPSVLLDQKWRWNLVVGLVLFDVAVVLF